MKILTIIIIILLISLLWTLVKFVLKLTSQVFSCGCLVILIIGAILLALGFIEIPAF